MKLNKITTLNPVKSEIKLSGLLSKSSHNPVKKEAASPAMSAARVNLEYRAEDMDPEDYIRMKTYLKDLEMAKFLSSNMDF